MHSCFSQLRQNFDNFVSYGYDNTMQRIQAITTFHSYLLDNLVQWDVGLIRQQ